MLAVLSKLIYLLTLSPFGAEAGLLKSPEIDREENEGLPPKGGQSRSEGRSASSPALTVGMEPRLLAALPGHSFLRDVGIVEGESPDHKKSVAAVTTFFAALVASLIAHGILQYSETQTIVFLVGYAKVLYLIGLGIGTIGLFLEKDTSPAKDINDSALAFLSLGGTMLITALVAKVFFMFVPPDQQPPPPLSAYFMPGRTEVAPKN